MAPRRSTRTWRWKRCSRCTPSPRTASLSSAEKAINNYVKAIGKGLQKIMSKMGISTYMSYCGAQIFEAIGLDRTLVDKYFRGTASKSAASACSRSPRKRCACIARRSATDPVLATMLDAGGEYAWRVRGEEHMWTPDAIAKLQHAARANSYETYKEYAQIINDQSRRHMTLRGLFEFRFDPSEGDPARRGRAGQPRSSSASPPARCRSARSRTEAHTTLAIAMNRIGGKSNTGEGGEDPSALPQELQGHPDQAGRHARRHARRKDAVEADFALQAGDSLRSRIKQVASGRFGVTAEYLVERRPDPDQDGAGRQAGRGRPAARPQGQRVHRACSATRCPASA